LPRFLAIPVLLTETPLIGNKIHNTPFEIKNPPVPKALFVFVVKVEKF
jgi:hypothetical protein